MRRRRRGAWSFMLEPESMGWRGVGEGVLAVESAGDENSDFSGMAVGVACKEWGFE